MSKMQLKKSDLVWSYVGNIFTAAASILLLPFVLAYLSDTDLGLWYVFIAVGQIVILLDFGFAATIARYIAYVWCGAKTLQKEHVVEAESGQTDFETFKLVLATCRYIYFVISIIALILMITAGSAYILSLKDITNAALIAWLIYALGVFLNLFYSYYTSFLRGIGAIAANHKANVAAKVAQLAITYVLLRAGLGLLGVSIGYVASGAVLRIVSMRLFYRHEDIGKSLAAVRLENKTKRVREMFGIIWHNAAKDGLVTIANYLSTYANTLICSAVLGLSTTGSYGLSVQIGGIIATTSSILYTMLQPSMQEMYAKGNMDRMGRLMSASYSFFILSYGIISLMVFAMMPVIRILKPGFSVDAAMFIAILLYMFIQKTYQLFTSFISNMNTIPYTQAFIVSAVIATVLSYVLAAYTSLEIWALVIAPTVVAIAYNAWKWPQHALTALNMSAGTFLKQGFAGIASMVRMKKLTL